VERLLEKKNLGWGELAFVGDDVNDHPVLEKAGFSACPSDAAGTTSSIVNYVCKRAGGHGAVREVCDFIISAKNAS
jgi:YrbI family 3-deoxy-D-manno-octulosonate 8-phosphate phosphatase